MVIWRSAIRTGATRRPRDHVRAAIVTALLLPVLALSVLWLWPQGCDTRGNGELYLWTCLLPGLLLTVPVVVAILLPLAHAVDRRLVWRLSDGWLVTTLAVGIATQVVLSGVYLVILDRAYRGLFLKEVLFLPQPFVAGALAGAVYWLALHGTGQSGADRPRG